MNHSSFRFGKNLSLSNYKGKYSFNRFNPAALNNIRNSAIIEKVLSPKYILNALKSEGYSDEENMWERFSFN